MMKILDIVGSERKYVSNIDYYLENEVDFLRIPIIGADFVFVHKGKMNNIGKVVKSYDGGNFLYIRTESGTGFIFYEEEVENAEN